MNPPERLRRLPMGLEEGHIRGPWGDTSGPAEPDPRCPLGHEMSKPRSLFSLVVLVLVVSAASEWWYGREQARLGAQIAAASAPGDIEMLSSRTCVFCDRAREWFGAHHVPVNECVIESDARCAERFAALRAVGTPVLVVRGQVQVGFNPELIAKALAARG
jgi:glutaredoxin